MTVPRGLALVAADAEGVFVVWRAFQQLDELRTNVASQGTESHDVEWLKRAPIVLALCLALRWKPELESAPG